jgi:hypothetical protein
VPIAIPLGVTEGSVDFSAVLSDANEAAVLSGGTYLNIHTSAFPGGELREQLAVTVCGTTVKRIYTATDSCGNSSTACVNVSIVDTTPPSITCPDDVAVECDASTDPSNTGEATATDLCQPSVGITYSDEIIAGSCPQEYTIIRTWYASDFCGNQSSCTQRISVDDTIAPSLTCPGDAVIECSIINLPPYQTFTLFIAAGGSASDNCALDESSFTLVSHLS